MTTKNYVFTFLLMAFAIQGFSQITGSVFRDFNGDGAKQVNEPLVPNITVSAYNTNDVLCGTTTTSGNTSPNYTLTGCGAGDVRLEFVIPDGGFAADSGIDYSALSGFTYGTSVRFVQGNSSNQDYALHYGGDYNSGTGSSELFIPKMNVNDPTGGGGAASSGAQTAFFGYNYNNSGTGAPNKAINGSTIGTAFGTAYSAQADVVFTSAFLRRHSGFGTLGSGGIYKLTPTASSFTAATFYDMDANGHRTRAAATGAPAYGSGTSYSISGTTVTYLGATDPVSGSPSGLGVIGSNSARGLATNVTTESNDPAAFDQVGKVSLGGLEISDDGKYLFVVNLYDRKVYRLTLNNAYNPTSVTAVTSYSLPSVTVSNGVLRPFGIKYDRGSLFVGAVGTGENGGTNTVGGSTDMNAYVFELEEAKGAAAFASTAILTYPLNYRKGRPMSWSGGSTLGNEWEAWTNNSASVFIVSGTEGTYPTPMLSDIEFSDRGDMIMSFVDRSGHQWGWHNRRHVTGTTQISYAVGGDLIMAGKNTGTGTYTVENNGSVTSLNGQTLNSGAANNQGIGNSEFFKGEFYTNSHEETSLGGVAVIKGAGEVACAVMDPSAIWSGGTQKLSTTNGAEIAGTDYQLYVTPNGSPATFGKANGLGELEILGEESPVEVGNRVWLDTDADGIQDPGENGISGVEVELCRPGADNLPGTADDVLVSSVTTDANGNFYFTTASGTSVVGVTYNATISYDSSYVLKIGSSDWNNTTVIGAGDLAGKKLTLSSQVGNGKTGLSDNDGFLSSADNVVIPFVITEVGGNNHDLDFGFRSVNVEIGNYVWIDTNGDGVQDVGEQPIAGVEVLLYDNAGNPIFESDTVVTCLSDDVRTDFSSNSASDNDGSINFNGAWNLDVTGSGSGNLSAYDEIVNNELSISGLNGVATRNITPPVYSIDTVIVSFRLKQVGFDVGGDNGIAEYYNGTAWVNLGTYTRTQLATSGTYYDFAYTSTSIPGLLDIEGVRFSEGSWSSSNEGFYIDDLQVEFKSTCTTAITTSTDPVKDTTDANGYYSFSTKEHGVLPSTNYEIRIPKNQDTVNHLSPTILSGGTTVTNSNGSLGGGGTYVTTGIITSPTEAVEVDTSFDFGFIPYSLGNVVWWDNDDDGILDDEEIGIPGVKLFLLDNTGAVLDSTITNASGEYAFRGLLPGNFQVAVMSSLTSGPLDGGAISSVTNTSNDLDDYNDGSATDPVGSTTVAFTSISNSITLGDQLEPTTESDEDANTNYPDNQSNLTLDFGFVPPTTAVGNYVFHDIDSNGVSNGTDTAIRNVKVYLYKDTNGDGVANELTDSTLTDNNGFYSFDSLGAGRFRLALAPDNFDNSGPLSVGVPTTHANSGDTLTDNNSEGTQSGVFILLPNSELLSDANDDASSLYDDDDANFTFDFGIKSNVSGGPVPVQLIYFTAKAVNNSDALVTWSTASEINNEKFIIERSINGEFTPIAEVKGQGSAVQTTEYGYTDYNVPATKAVYRLRQVDYDGREELFGFELVKFNRTIDASVYPNPTVSRLFVKSESEYTYTIISSQGQTLLEGNESPQGIDVSGLPAGSYYITLRNDGMLTNHLFQIVR